MEKTQYKLQTIGNMPASADLVAKRLVKVSSGKIAYSGLKEKALGVLEVEVGQDEIASIIVQGIVLVEVGAGGVTEMADITSDANGKAIVDATGKTNGLSLDTVSAGGFTRVKLI